MTYVCLRCGRGEPLPTGSVTFEDGETICTDASHQTNSNRTEQCSPIWPPG